ncbi:MAG: hypothetical protein Q9172_003256 [Xanthocarpia lactea]
MLMDCTGGKALDSPRSDAMSDPRQAIVSLRLKNFEFRNFVPYRALYGLMDSAFVGSVVEACDMPVFRKEEVIRIVLNGARRLFAILLLLGQQSSILRFIEKDQFQFIRLDDKLPLTLPVLKEILLSDTTAEEFSDLQWEFTAPEFSYSALHRTLHPSTILPFIGNPKFLGEGGFGRVSEVSLPQHLEDLDGADALKIPGLVRKEFIPSADGRDELTAEREQTNLHILFHEEDFLLADFGLARLKPATESSKSDFVAGSAWYLAPECEDCEDEFEKHTISRPSDIWSFGCILAECLTYLLEGREGIDEFRKTRKVKFGIVTTYTFHAGRFSTNPGVVAWMLHLRNVASRAASHLAPFIPLVEQMLKISPTERPSAGEVMSVLQQAYMSVSVTQLLESFGRVQVQSGSYEIKAEYERFRLWGMLWCIPSTAGPAQLPATSESSDSAFEPVVGLLKGLERQLQELSNPGPDGPCILRHAVVETIDSLCGLLSSGSQRRLQVRLEQELIANANVEELSRAQEALANTPMHRRLGILATIKRVSELAASRKTLSRPDLQFQSGLIQCTKRTAEYELGSVVSPQQLRPIQVLQEHVRYDLNWEGPVSEEMLVRIEAIAEMHSQEDKPTELRSLCCVGFYHDAREHAFALVYDFPIKPESDDESTQVYSLQVLLERSQHWKERPVLDDRYRLACMLAVSLLEFHNINWLHKGMSASHIIFFRNETLQDKKMTSVKDLEDPYIIGFNHSRPDEPAAFTDGPGTGGDSRKYQHPQYAEHKHRYRPEFDYYSLGLVLLEIGLWLPLADMTGRHKLSSLEEQRSYLLDKCVPLLGHQMGREYATAVKVCLDYFGSTDCVDGDSQSKILKFNDNVVEKLSTLNRD